MQGGDGAIKSNDGTEFLQSEIWFGFKLLSDGLTMGTEDLWLAPRAMVLGTDVAETATLLDQLLDHAQGNAEAVSDLIPCYITFIVGGQDSLTEVEGKCGHESIIAPLFKTATVLFKLL